MTVTNTLKDIRSIYRVDQESSKTYLSNQWIIVAPLVVSGLNHAEDISQLYQWMNEDIDRMEDLNSDEKLSLKAQVVAKQRDALLKGIIPYGYPKTIMGTRALYDVTSQEIKDLLPKEPIRKDTTWQDIQAQRKRGKEFFDLVYGKNKDKTRAELSIIYPDLGAAIQNSPYDSLLSELSVTNAKETSLILVAGCFSLQLTPLLVGHIAGAKNNGATDKELDRIYDSVRQFCALYNVPTPLLPEQV